MKRIGIVFPGQGSQAVGMGKDLYDQSDLCKTLFEKANQVLGTHLTEIIFDGPKELLTQTQHAQPAIFLVSACVFTLLKERNLNIHLMAGHSLGELTAYYASGALSFETALNLIKVRGEAMAAAYPSEKSGMAAIMGMDQNTLEACVAPFKDSPVVLANINCPGQIVISGDKQGLETLYPILKEKGAKVIPLAVSGAFHSPLMRSASEKLSTHVQNISIQNANPPIILNRLATPDTQAESLRENIAQQVISPVRWIESMTYMLKHVDTVIECGPGKVLSGLMRKISPDTEIQSIGSLEALALI